MSISNFLSKTMTHFVFQRKSTIEYYQICYLNNELLVYQFQKNMEILVNLYLKQWNISTLLENPWNNGKFVTKW